MSSDVGIIFYMGITISEQTQLHQFSCIAGETEFVEDAPSEVPTFIQFTHHSYSQMVRELKKVASRCSHIAKLYSIGRSFEGKDLFVIEFSTSPGHHELRE